MSATRAIAAIVALGASASAQPRTWVVNSWFGAAHDFIDLPPAFAAAAPGDTIEVHKGSRPYSAVTTNKGVSVVATPDWTAGAPITVTDLPAGQAFRLAGLTGIYPLRLHRCAGSVHIDTLTMSGPGAGHGQLEIVDCSLVTLDNCWITDMVVRDSTVVMNHTAVDGWVDPFPVGLVAYPALRMTDSDVTASECSFRGAHAAPTGSWPAVPGIEMQGGRLRLAATSGGSAWAQGGHVLLPSGQLILSPAIQSDGGVVVVDPDMVIPRYDGPAFSGTSPVITEQIPFVSLWHVFPGYPLDCSVATCPILDGPPGASAWILVSLPTAPLATPFGDFWLHPPSTITVAGGTIDPAGEMRGTIDLRSVLRPGDATTWQGVVLDASGGLRLTHPVVPVLGIY